MKKPSDEMDTIAYAVSFMEASKKLAETEWEDNHPLIVPFYLLIGFSLENALKAVLEFNASNKSTNGFTRMISENCGRSPKPTAFDLALI